MTTFLKEDLEELIMICINKVLDNYEIKDKRQVQNKEEILTIEDVQELFKVSKVTIHKWKKKGLIPFYKMKKKVYFKRSEIFDDMSKKKRKMEI